MDELKKISLALLIKGEEPLKLINEFCDKNENNNTFNVQNEDIKDKIAFKKVKIFGDLQDFSLKYYNNKFSF